jgi:very-short-patch-repair endonuclease
VTPLRPTIDPRAIVRMRRAALPAAGSKGEAAILTAIAAGLLPRAEVEYRFHATRMWRVDFAWPDILIAVEVEGGTWAEGRHTRGDGFLADLEKYNALALDGWCLLRFVTEQCEDGTAVDVISAAIADRRKV